MKWLGDIVKEGNAMSEPKIPTLKTEAVMRRLRTLLEFHQKLVMENKDQQRMMEVSHTIYQLAYMLERINRAGRAA